MRYGLRAQSAPLVRVSSRRIMSMRFRPAHISVINRRDTPSAVTGAAVWETQGSPAGSVPAEPAHLYPGVPERCSRSRVRFAAPHNGAPLPAVLRSGLHGYATGGSGGNTHQSFARRGLTGRSISVFGCHEYCKNRGADPWSARDALVPLCSKEIIHLPTGRPTRASAADQGSALQSMQTGRL